MWIKIGLFLVCLSATVWLWGHWSFNKATGWTFLLALNSGLLFYLMLWPVYKMSQKGSAAATFRSLPYKIIYIVYVASTLILGISSFYGLMLYILPLKVLLLGAYGYLKYRVRVRKTLSTKTQG